MGISNNDYGLKPWHVLMGTALCAVPYISPAGDFLKEAVKAKKVDKTPIKDCFRDVAEKHGTKYSEWLSKIKVNTGKFSAVKVGAIGMGIVTALDLVLTTACVKAGANISKRKREKS